MFTTLFNQREIWQTHMDRRMVFSPDVGEGLDHIANQARHTDRERSPEGRRVARENADLPAVDVSDYAKRFSDGLIDDRGTGSGFNFVADASEPLVLALGV